jgi:CitMHS family citrate-Mg2+:H+ or citrate-Ca2+:H+ symporter
VSGAIMDAIESFAPTAALFFAIIYFGLMIDVGLFDPLIRFILRVVGNDPVRLVIGTAVLAGAVSLDGDGSTTFIITVAALLPIYLRLGMSPVVLTVVACLANGVLNIVPWGGPTIRAATVLKVSADDLFVPMAPGMIAGLATVLVLAFLMGRSEKKRLLASGTTLESVSESLESDRLVRTGGGGDGGLGDGGLGIVPPHPGGSAEAELDYDEDNPT